MRFLARSIIRWSNSNTEDTEQVVPAKSDRAGGEEGDSPFGGWLNIEVQGGDWPSCT